MSTLAQELSALKTAEDKITGNKVANFAYDDYAYEHDDANGVDTYNVNNHQNIPNGTANILKVNPTILTKGWRAQASAITRMLLDHFLGRCSYNLNKINDHFSTLLTTLGNYLGVADGIATLDSNGKILDSQLKRNVPWGLATLDGSAKLNDAFLRMGEANGLATLDDNVKVPDSQLNLDQPYGIPKLDANIKIPDALLKLAVANGIATLNSNAQLPLNQLPNHASTTDVFGSASDDRFGHVKVKGGVFIKQFGTSGSSITIPDDVNIVILLSETKTNLTINVGSSWYSMKCYEDQGGNINVVFDFVSGSIVFSQMAILVRALDTGDSVTFLGASVE